MAKQDDLHLAERPDDRGDMSSGKKSLPPVLATTAFILIAGVGGWLWWTQRATPESRPPTEQVAPTNEAQLAASAAPAPVTPTIQYPVPAAEESQALRPAGIAEALIELLGRKAVESFVHTEDFPRRFVATVDNLGRDHAPPAAWPIAPTPGRFIVEERAVGTVIAQENAARYTPLVLLAGTLDATRVAQLYRRMYPLLQQSYRELGFGDRYFNDRLIEVIDLLLATPEPAEAPKVQLTEVKGPIPSVQPWTRYEFADPGLESLAAGQKILVRMGLVNQRRLKGKLRELRDQLALHVPGRTAPR